MVIGIDLNNVVRAFNDQVIEYYNKAYNDSFVLGERKPEDVDIQRELPFPSKDEKNRFFYEEYPFEIFGCATTMDVMLLPKLNEWMKEMEDKGNKVVIVSFGEEILGMPSTIFFISKLGLKARRIRLPKKANELDKELDMLVTANPKVLRHRGDYTLVGIERGYNTQDVCQNADIIFKNLEEFLQWDLKSGVERKDRGFLSRLKRLFKRN